MSLPRAWHFASTLSISVQRKSPLVREINQPICTGMTGGAVLKCGRDRAILGKDLIRVASMQSDLRDKGLRMKIHFCPRLTLSL